MKKYFFFAAAAIVAASCAKTPAPVQTPDGPEAPAVEGKVAVQFGTNISANVETKSVGSVDAWAESQKLYVYGFARVKPTESEPIWDFGDDQTTFPFINNVAASAPNGSTSGSIDVKDKDGKPFYYQNTTTYDFFGYYVDDAYENSTTEAPKPALSEDKDAFVLPITINGGQDIMLASASVADAISGLSLTGWDDKYAFSAYAARRGVHPKLKFEHQLTQIQLYVQSGTNFADNPKLKINSAEFLEVNTAADLYIAVQKGSAKTVGVVNERNSGSIFVTEATSSEAPINLTRKALTELTLNSKGSDPQALGACTMLFPKTSYKVNLNLSQETSTGSNKFEEQTLPLLLDIKKVKIAVTDSNGINPGESGYIPTYGDTITSQEIFEKGYRYNVYVTVYGLEKVDVTVALSPWVDGGKLDIDTDEAPEF